MSEGRDYAADMRAVIDAETSHGPYVSRQAARDIVEKLLANDPDLLSGWLYAQAEQMVWSAINDRDRSMRSRARTNGPRTAFGEAAASGDADELTPYLDCPYPLEDGTRRRLADLTRDDLMFVASEYDARAKSNAMEAAFFRAIAKKVKTGRVADFFTEEALRTLHRSLVKE